MAVIGTLVETWTEKTILVKSETKRRNKLLETKYRGHLCYTAVKNWPSLCAVGTLWDTERRTRLSGAVQFLTAVLGN